MLRILAMVPFVSVGWVFRDPALPNPAPSFALCSEDPSDGLPPPPFSAAAGTASTLDPHAHTLMSPSPTLTPQAQACFATTLWPLTTHPSASSRLLAHEMAHLIVSWDTRVVCVVDLSLLAPDEPFDAAAAEVPDSMRQSAATTATATPASPPPSPALPSADPRGSLSETQFQQHLQDQLREAGLNPNAAGLSHASQPASGVRIAGAPRNPLFIELQRILCRSDLHVILTDAKTKLEQLSLSVLPATSRRGVRGPRGAARTSSSTGPPSATPSATVTAAPSAATALPSTPGAAASASAPGLTPGAVGGDLLLPSLPSSSAPSAAAPAAAAASRASPAAPPSMGYGGALPPAPGPSDGLVAPLARLFVGEDATLVDPLVAGWMLQPERSRRPLTLGGLCREKGLEWRADSFSLQELKVRGGRRGWTQRKKYGAPGGLLRHLHRRHLACGCMGKA